MIKTDDSPRVRAYCVSQLAALRRFDELAEVLKMNDGQLRLAAAFALGDQGILAGVPILIEALRLSDPELRAVAAQKLTEYTGQHFGYRPQGTPEDREAAIARWNQWWNENGAELVRTSLRTHAPDSVGSTITTEERDRAKELWSEANRRIALAMREQAPDASTGPAPAGAPAAPAPQSAASRRAGLDQAQELLRQALDLDPSLSSARMTRAVLLYEELGRPRDAEKELFLILDRAEHDDTQDPNAAKKFANYHLGMICLREGMWERATVRFSQALQYDPDFGDALLAMGDTHLARAFASADQGGPADPAARREALDAARQAFRQALASLEKQEADLRSVTRDLVSEAPDTLAEGQALQAVRRSLGALQRQRAAVHFRLGRVCAALQDDDGTRDAYRTACTLDPGNETYRDALKAWGGDAPPAPTTSDAPPAAPPGVAPGGGVPSPAPPAPAGAPR
jgi:tetratricopeptide (TPR) repeat protein